MKSLTFLFLFYTIAITPLSAQPLIDGGIESSGYGGIVFKGTEVTDESVLMIGGRGGVTLNERFGIGFAFYRLVGDIDAPEGAQTNPDQTIDLDMDYAGLDLEYTFPLHQSLHLSVQTLIGAGRAQYWEGDDKVLVEDGVVVVEPGVDLKLKLTRFFRIGLGASYRFISDIERLDGLESRDFNAGSANLIFEFGKF